MKLLRIFLILAVLFTALGSVSGSVDAQYKYSYQSTVNIQNLANTPGTVTFTYYHGNGSNGTAGSVASTADISLAANEFKAIGTLQVASGFRGSVVISSSTPVASVSNIHGNNKVANASYIGSTTGSTNVRIPLLMKANYGYDTWFSLQNAGSGDANVTINYSDGTSTTAVIKPGASLTFNQATENHPVKVFSAQITSNQPVIAAVIEESSTVLFAYNGFSTGSKRPVMPLINTNNYGYTTSAEIMNIGTQPSDVTVTYTPKPGSGNGTACTETISIPAGSSKTFVTNAFKAGSTSPSNCAKGARFVGSAAVTANSAEQDLVVVVNQHKLPTNGEAYSGFAPAAATPKVVLPLLMDRNYGWFTSVNIMNVGTSPVKIFCDLTGTSNDIVVDNVQPNQLVNAEQTAIAAGWVGSGTCYAYQPGTTTIDPNAKIVGVVNQLLKGSTKDEFMVYEGINVAP